MENKRMMAFLKLLNNSSALRGKYYLNEGSSREAYALGDLVVKVPCDIFNDMASESGILQTKREIDVWKRATEEEKSLLVPLVTYGEYKGVPFVVMKKIRIAENLEDTYLYDNNEIGELAESKGWLIAPTFMSIMKNLMEKYNLRSGDFFENSGNWGLTEDDRVVLCDYGFSGWDDSEYKDII